jgi:hypothetical protein
MSVKGFKHLKNRNEIERKTIKVAIKEEKKEGRKIKIVSPKKPYDIKSIGKKPEDIRFIEVKGHINPKEFNYIKLTEREYNFAKKNEEKYFIYLINFIKEKPIIIKIRNPIKKLKWKKEVIKRRKGVRFETLYEKYNIQLPEIFKEEVQYVSTIDELLKSDMNDSFK